MNLSMLSAEELIKSTDEISGLSELSELEQALLRKLIEVKSELGKASDLLEKATTTIDAATEI